jgi:hypothetical protein
MPYRAILDIEARHDLARLPKAVYNHVIHELSRLAADPVGLSVRSHFPFREKCQLFPFDFDDPPDCWEFNALFQYGQDEQTIYILAVGISTRPIDDGRLGEYPHD